MLVTTNHIAVQLISALSWNPTVRGFLFPLIMFSILAGSSWLILYTNVGNRLGFLIAASAFFGWMTMMSGVWMIYGIGLKGTPAHWVVKEHIVGPTANAQYEPGAKLTDAKLWKSVPDGTPIRADAQASVDTYLAPSADSGKPLPTALYKSNTDYLPVNAVQRGGDNELFQIHPFWEKNPRSHHKFFLKHSPHWFVMQVQGVKTQTYADPYNPGTPKTRNVLVNKKPVVDPTKPVVTVFLLRNLGSQRQPPMMVFLFSGILLTVCLGSLHKRDKAVMAELKSSTALARA